VVRDLARQLHGELEIAWRLPGPALVGGHGMAAVEGGVDLHAAQLRRIPLQVRSLVGKTLRAAARDRPARGGDDDHAAFFLALALPPRRCASCSRRMTMVGPSGTTVVAVAGRGRTTGLRPFGVAEGAYTLCGDSTAEVNPAALTCRS